MAAGGTGVWAEAEVGTRVCVGAVTGADVGEGTWVGMIGAGVEVGRAASERGSPGRVEGAGEGEGRVGAGGLGCGETTHRSVQTSSDRKSVV